ncbi:type I restriction-modification system subunit M [Enterococcus hirae]|uniref:type I restriction-modification system subunit M n=1 Tax=Enterococcus hirae TaxID=1354 RepID=UPI001A969488|nr:class I SAM-dependent DNA methyltransferase [Enterococcus hirae]MBO1102337.1 SAM-dependent DNA methyltransferase [Enterococcus hirae]
MITGTIKSKIDNIWTTLWTEGSTNPLTNIEQLTYLLFMKDLDRAELEKEKNSKVLDLEYIPVFPKEHPEYRWHTFKDLGNAQEMFNLMQQKIFPFIKNLNGENDDTAFSRYMKDAIFQINKPGTLQKVVEALEELPTEDRDMQGDIYEYLLSKLATSGTNGQFRTPRHIIKMMVDLMAPTPQDTISDPAMGSAGFLVEASEYVRKHHPELFLDSILSKHYHNNMFHGNDMDSTMLRIGAMNMMLHGVDNPQIKYQDSLSQDNLEREKYSLILANPPFKGSLDYDTTANDLLAAIKTKKTELLFLALFLRTLKPGGRAAVIVPDGVLFGSSKAHKDIRKEIVEKNKLAAVISMPSGVFKPYAGVSTAILIFTKTEIGGTDNVWFYDMQADGYSLDDKRNPIKENDIPDIVERFKNRKQETERKRTDQSFMVPVDELKENDYDLSINKYKEIEYDEVVYENPKIIIEKIEKIEKEISLKISDLKKNIGESDDK